MEAWPENSMKLAPLLFPPEPRGFPARRTVRAALRAAHTLAGGLLLGAHLFHAGPEAALFWLQLTLASGLAFLAIDLHASCAILLELRGLLVLAKLALTGLVAVFPGQAVALLGTVLVAGSVGSHLPGRFRHHIWWPGAQPKVDSRTG
jgi:hypothetical protein